MPALRFLKRKWLVACDDLVIPFGIEAVVRVIWLVCLGVILSLKIKNCDENATVAYFLYLSAVDLFLVSFLDAWISFTSAKGLVLQVEQRRCVSKLMYVKLITVVLDIVIASFGTYLFVHMEGSCISKEVFVKCTTVGAWIYLLIILAGFFVCYDSLGSSKYWNTQTNPNSLNFFKKAQYIWKMRLKLFCCCADISEDNDLIYVEISTSLASFINGSDLVPTDILAGIITLSEKHALERKKHLLGVQSVPYSNELLESHQVPDWMTPENALYFLRIAKSTYGWIAFYDTCHPWNLFALSTHARCCVNRRNDQNEGHIDNCCYCNFAAVQKITGFKESDIIYASFENNIHEPAFYLAFDHNRRCLVLSIRGTRSFSDLVTDLDAEASEFVIRETQVKFKCHRGVYRSALYLHKKIIELNLLDIAFAENPSYTLAIAGHSLGGSVAAILSLMLRPRFPDLQCYAYGPLAAFSVAGLPDTLDFVFSVVVGEDMSPRLSAKALRELRLQIFESLNECKLPKYKILMRACWYHLLKYLNMKPEKNLCEIFENQHYEHHEQTTQPDNSIAVDESNLFAPGRILYFERNKWYEPYWVTGLNLQNITINPDMIADHQPHKIQNMLELYIKGSVEASEDTAS